jgi:hypothetical protein
MRGGMTESQEGCAKWDDVSKETFERFAQFAYTGDYSVEEKRKTRAPKRKKAKVVFNGSFETPTAAECGPAPAEDAPEVDSLLVMMDKLSSYNAAKIARVQVLMDELSSYTVKEKKAKTGSPTPSSQPEEPLYGDIFRYKYPERHPFNLTTDFQSLSFSSKLAPRNNYANTCEPSETFNSNIDYASIFVAHATLYILADYRLVDSLKALALYKLHKTLCTFQLTTSNVEDVVKLARYVYAEEGGNEGSGKEDGTVGELRALVCKYLAMHALFMVLDEGFMDLLAEGGQFVKDFFRFEVQRVVS